MVWRIALFMICLQLALVGTSGQQASPPESQKQQPPAAAVATTRPSFAEAIRKSVGFLAVRYLKEGQSATIAGTFFFVFYEDKRLGDDRGFIYLVTNRHMVDPEVEKGLHYPVQQVSVRLNLRTPVGQTESEVADIPLASGLRWVLSADGAVDLAVLPFAPDQKRYDYEPLPVSLFATQDTLHSANISPGDQVLFTGYFVQYPGGKRIQPIVREGVLAMIPDEEVTTTLQRPGHVYFADVHTFHGNSGSPVFVNLGGMRNGAMYLGANYRLLGVVSGYYPEDADFMVTAATTLAGTVHANSGITTIVPASELLALLDSPVLRAARDAVVAMEKAESPTKR